MRHGSAKSSGPYLAAVFSARLFALLVFLPALALAAERADTETEEAPGETTEEAARTDACDKEPGAEQLQEQSRETLRSWSCHSFRWFDGLFGDSEDFDENAVSGFFTAGAEYDQYDGFDPRLRIRVRAPLPNVNRRWDLILGRVDEEAYVSDTDTEEKPFLNPGLLRRDTESEWLLGLGHRGRQRGSGWDWSAGVRLRVPPRPYAKLRYYYNASFSKRTDLHFGQTFFWRSDQGFGTTSRGDLIHELDFKNVLRWEAIATDSEETVGTQWYFGHTWYHLFEGENGISLVGFVRGETNQPVSVQEYGLSLIWRRPFTRDWLWLSLGPSITWPRELPEEERELSLGFGAWIEMEIGAWRY